MASAWSSREAAPASPAPRLAARQRGAFTLAQADELGWPARAVHRRAALGELRAPQPGVLAFAASPATWEQRLLVATLSAGRGTGISHESAAVLHRCEDWIEPAVVRSLSARMGAGTAETDWRLPLQFWSLLSLEWWLRRYL